MIIKAGYRLSVTSWENDADNYQTHSIDGLSDMVVKNLIKLVSLFKSESRSPMNFGNMYEPSEVKIEKLDKELIKFKDSLGDKDAKNDEEHINCIKEHWLSELGIYSSGDFYTRVYEKHTVEYVPTEIVIEDVTENLKVYEVNRDTNRQFPTSAQLKFVEGDATNPITSPFCIIHICNNEGGWGAGFVLAISKKWKEPEKTYRSARKWKLGEVQWVPIDGNFVVNMIAQDGFKTSHNHVPLDYDALDKCLEKVYQGIPSNYTVHCPKIGTGLAGGKWEKVEELIRKHMRNDTFVYNWKG